MIYDFIEIGTSWFDTLIQAADDSTVGISVEPIDQYLNSLPDKKNVTKLCAAVVPDEDYSITGLDVYYVDIDDIRKHGLGDWLSGCNSVGRPHDFHLHYYGNPTIWHLDQNRENLPTINLVEMGIVRQKKIRCLTFEMLIAEFNIEKIKLLKTDTEGNDSRLVLSLMNYLTKSNKLDLLPEKIIYENNNHNKTEDMDKAAAQLEELGYNVFRNGIHDTVATLIRG